MNWFLIALAAPLLWSINNHIDKHLIETYYRHIRAGTLMLFTSIVSALFSIGILAFNRHNIAIPLHDALIVVAAGMVYFLAIFPYIFALLRDEASKVVPLFQVQPIFAYLLAFIFLHEHLSIHEVVAGAIIIAGAMLINMDMDNGYRLKMSVFWLMMLSAGLFSTEAFLFKFVGINAGFWPTAFYQYAGTALAGLLMAVAMPGYRRDFIQLFQTQGKKVFPISLLNESFNVLARVCFNYASLLAPLALVTLVNGFQPFFVIVIGVAITVFWPKWGEESLLRKHLIQKLLAVIIIFAGTYLLFHS